MSEEGCNLEELSAGDRIAIRYADVLPGWRGLGADIDEAIQAARVEGAGCPVGSPGDNWHCRCKLGRGHEGMHVCHCGDMWTGWTEAADSPATPPRPAP